MKRLVKATSILSTVSIGEMLMRFMRTKLVAIFLGPAGTGIISALTLFLGSLSVIGSLGTRRAVVKQAAVAQKEGLGSPRYREVLSTGFFLVLATSSLVALTVLFFSASISKNLFGHPEFYGYVMAIGLTLPAASLFSLFGAILKGTMQYASFAKYTLAAYSLVFLSMPPLIYFWGVWGAIGSLFLFYAFPIVAYMIYHFRQPYLFFSKRVNWVLAKEQCHDGFNFAYGEALSSFSQLVVISWITTRLGLEQMGLYQVVLTLTTVYMSIPTNAVSGYTLPAIAQAENNTKINEAVNHTLRLLYFILIPIVACLMIWPRLFIEILYSDKFIDARLPLRLQLFGVCFSIISHALGSSLVARGKMKALYCVSTVNAAAYMVCAFLMFNKWELVGVAMAYTISLAVTCAVLYMIARHYFAIRIVPENMRLLLGTLLWLSVSFYYGSHWHLWYQKMSLIVLAAPWFWVSSTSGERQYLWGKVRGALKR